MARSFRFYPKKRGNRRTGSGRLGRLGEALFFAVFLAVGCGVLVLMVTTLLVPQWRLNHDFVETTCKVLDKRIAEEDGEDGTLYRPELEVEYHVGGRTYRVWAYDIPASHSSGREAKRAVIDGFSIYTEENKKLYPCWYDPAEPGTVALVRGYSWLLVVVALPLVFILVGGGGLLYSLFHWGKSVEHRAATTRHTSQQRFPNIPDDSDITNSPGTTLDFRLPMATSPGWALFGALAVCLFWNGIVSVFVVIAVNSHLEGDPEWFLTFFIIPFVLVGLGLVVFFFRQLLITTGVGPTLVEISDHPLYPGKQYKLFLSQSGRLVVNSLEVSLLCEEEATYRQGTNTRTETREVRRDEVFRREGFRVHSGLPFETECEFNIPADAMHSFKSDHNGINWKVVVKGDIASWPDYTRSFPVIIRPANARGNV